MFALLAGGVLVAGTSATTAALPIAGAHLVVAGVPLLARTGASS